MDLQSATDGEYAGDDDSATAVLRRDHQAVRKLFAHYRELMNSASPQRAAVAQDIGMHFELHFAVTRDLYYPALNPDHAEVIHELLNAQEDIQQCIETLRNAQSLPDAELDSIVVRMIELADLYICRERSLMTMAEERAGPRLDGLGARMIRRREKIAGAVADLQSRS